MSKKGCVIFLTGLPCSGKTTIAEDLYNVLLNGSKPLVHYDGDTWRKENCPELGFSEADRVENLSRLGLRVMTHEMDGCIVICSFIAPYTVVREDIRNMCDNFIEVHVHADRQTCVDRDVKGMWQKAIEGEIENFTGHTDPYEEPVNPEVICFTAQETVQESVGKILNYLEEQKII